jgi:UDP-N-acetylmuramate dehydrogenase
MNAEAREVLAPLERETGLRVRWDEPMKTRTTFRCAARAAAVALPADSAQLTALVKALAAAGLPWGVLGRGSNLLVRDGGYPGVLIDLSDGFSAIEPAAESGDSVEVRAGAGVGNGTLLSWLRERNLAGFGFSFGIPGSVGGGVRMNAGTPLGWFGDVVTRVEGLSRTGFPVDRVVTPADFAYRDFVTGRDLVITAATLRFQRGDAAGIEAEIAAAKAKRANQPLELPNFGSCFKNPPGDHAGRLIEAAGLKGASIGGAQISPKHANFIVNLGEARASDALALMGRARDEVRSRFGVDLEPEVHVIGEDA